MPGDNGAAELGLDAVFSNSSISSFLSCEKKFAYMYRDGFSAPRVSRQMTLGSTVHHLLDGWWTGTDVNDLDVDDIAQFVISLEETPTIEECESIADHALWLMRRYDKMYDSQRDKVSDVQVEQTITFELPQLGERKFGLICKIDKLMHSTAHGGLIFMDHKTSGGKGKEDQADMDQQFSLYTLALRAMGTPVICSFIDEINTYRNKRKGEFLEWDDKAIPVEYSFARVLVDRSDAMLDVVAQEAYRACDRMWNLREGNYEPLRHIHFACPSCSFRSPCFEGLQGDAASEQALLQEHFSNREGHTPVSSSISQEEEVFLD